MNKAKTITNVPMDAKTATSLNSLLYQITHKNVPVAT
jgi:hypothetical protein